MKYESELKLATKAAVMAGRYLKEHFAAIDSSIGKDIKLQNDKESEKIIIDILEKTGIPILSEESGVSNDNSDDNSLLWVVDPLDGSANYWKEIPELTCVSIALYEKETPVLGVINRYDENELYTGVAGIAAKLNGHVIHPSNIQKIENAVFATGFPVKRAYDDESLHKFITQIQKFKKIRMLGSAALMGVFVACGKVDAYSEEEIMFWDIAAASAIVKAAGGIVDIKRLDDEKCICKLFANEKLFEEYQSIN